MHSRRARFAFALLGTSVSLAACRDYPRGGADAATDTRIDATQASDTGDARTSDARLGERRCTEDVVFSDVHAQVLEFIGYNSSIQLTADQEAIKREALEALPAPCCSDNTAYTCCCPCNLAKTNWGLSHHMIADLHCSALEVREKVAAWILFVNPNGFSGDSCYTGGCGRAFQDNGCGGMDESNIVFE